MVVNPKIQCLSDFYDVLQTFPFIALYTDQTVTCSPRPNIQQSTIHISYMQCHFFRAFFNVRTWQEYQGYSAEGCICLPGDFWIISGLFQSV